MRLIDRYVLRELMVPFGIGIAIGVLLLIGTLLFNCADLIINKGIPLLLVLKLIFLKVPAFAVIAFPMAMAFASALAINRLARDSELTPMRLSGVPFRRIVRAILLAGVAASLLSYLTAEKVAPWANERANRILRQMWMQSVAPTAQPNVFLKSDSYTFYIGWLEKVRKDYYLLRTVLVYDTRLPGFPVWYTAREATTTRRFWVLRDVVRRDIGADGMTVHETHLPELTIDLAKDVDFIGGLKTPEEMPADELATQIRLMKSTGASNMARAYEVDWHFRFSLPLACLVFGLIGAPVSFRFSRGGTWVGVLVSIVICFFYWNVFILSKLLGTNGVLPAWVAAWMQNAAFGSAALLLLWRSG